jgi:hypothetical protein
MLGIQLSILLMFMQQPLPFFLKTCLELRDRELHSIAAGAPTFVNTTKRDGINANFKLHNVDDCKLPWMTFIVLLLVHYYSASVFPASLSM